MNNILKSSVLLCLLFLGNISLFAQEKIPAKIAWSEELKEPRGTYLSKVITQDETGFYILREKVRQSTVGDNSTKIYVERYDNNMVFKQGEQIDLKYEKKDREFIDVIVVGDEMYCLTSFHNQKHKINYLFAQRITHKLRLVDDLIKIGEVPTKSFLKDGSFGYHLSEDDSKVLIYNSLPYDKGEPEQFAFHVYDNQFNELWSKNVRLPYNDERFRVQEYQVDREGNVYVLGIIYEEGFSILNRKKPNYTYTILAYTNNGQDKKEYKIKLQEKFITDLTFNIANDGDLVCSGFYSEKGTFSIKGTYFFRVNTKTEEVYNKNLKAFDIDFITQELPERRAKKVRKNDASGKKNKVAELYQYDLDELILRSDGGALLIAEQYYIEERMNNNTGFGNRGFNNNNAYNQYDYYYYYNDIIVVNIKPNGEIEWSARIPKRQLTINDGGYFSSYAHAIVQDKIYFVYNDNRRNHPRESKRIYNFDGKYSVIALAQVSQDGSVSTMPIYNNRDADIITRPKVCKQTGQKEMIIYGEHGRNFRFANLQFQ